MSKTVMGVDLNGTNAEIKLVETLNKLDDEFDELESFIEADSNKSKRFKEYLKHLYDYLKLNENYDFSSNVVISNSKANQSNKISPKANKLQHVNVELPELIIEEDLVDSEQIYQQLQLLNTNDLNGESSGVSINSLTKFFSKSLLKIDELSFNIDASKRSKLKNGHSNNYTSNSSASVDDQTGSNEEADQSDSGSEDLSDNNSVDSFIKKANMLNMNGTKTKKKETENDIEESKYGIPDGSDSEISDFDVNDFKNGDEDDEDEDEDEEEDDLGDLDEDELEDDEEEEEMKTKSNKTKNDEDIDSDEVDDDLVDLYQDLGDEKEVMELGKKMKSFEEIDFDREDFGLVDDEDGEGERYDYEKDSKPVKNSNKKDLKTTPKTKDLFDDQDDEDENEEETGNKSSFEIRQEKLKESIDQIHDSMLNGINNKQWQLKGETDAKTRPQDSLLEEYLEFDHQTRQLPQINVSTTEMLEKMIKQRIKDKAFDDVERKVKPVEMAYEYKKQIALDHEKSKVGLGDVYEQEFLKQQEKLLKPDEADVYASTDKATTLENKKHDEIRKLMQSLFVKLDALSNFHFTPKAPVPELKVVSNMPTINMEEVAPVSVADSNILAPEEIKDKINSLPKSKSEEDKKDKNRKLRVKKAEIKKTKAKKEKRLLMAQAMDPDNANIGKELAMSKLKKQAKNMSQNIKILKTDKKTKVNSAYRSSSAFFKQLQENTQMSKKVAVKKKSTDNDSNKKTSKKLKL